MFWILFVSCRWYWEFVLSTSMFKICWASDYSSICIKSLILLIPSVCNPRFWNIYLASNELGLCPSVRYWEPVALLPTTYSTWFRYYLNLHHFWQPVFGNSIIFSLSSRVLKTYINIWEILHSQYLHNNFKMNFRW